MMTYVCVLFLFVTDKLYPLSPLAQPPTPTSPHLLAPIHSPLDSQYFTYPYPDELSTPPSTPPHRSKKGLYC